MKVSWRTELPQLLIIAVMFCVAAWSWQHVPDRVPVHWNIHGNVDRMGGKFESLLLMPIATTGVYLLLLFVPRIDPGRANYASFIKAYNAMRIAVMLFMAVFYGFLVSIAFGHRLNVASFVLVPMGILFMVLGNYMGKLRPNWFAGVRTPWTLSSKLSWDKTHQQAGWLLLASGALFVVAGCLPVVWMIVLAVAFQILSITWLVVYSYLIYRRDPNRTSPAGTSPGGE